MILVLGATGTVGQETVKALKAKGLKVSAASRQPQRATEVLGIPARAWNWEEPGSFPAALSGIDALFLLIPPGTMKDLSYAPSAIAAAKAAGVKKIVRLSVIGAAKNPSGDSYKIEQMVEASGLKFVHVRPTFFNQNTDEGLLPGIKAGHISLPTGEGKTSFIDARDIGAVSAEALGTDRWDGQGLELTGPSALSYGDQARILSAQAGIKVAFHDVSPEAFKAAGLKSGMSEAYADFMVGLYGFVKAGYMAALADGVQTVLGREPISFEQYARDYAEKFRS
jgi:uncharacterized protein YbjT (DUF2867 family)